MRQVQLGNQGLWYMRRGDVVQGPYPAGLIARYIILGRIRTSDELSQDLKSWTALAQLPELIPEVVQAGMDDPVARQRLMAAKRWEDERARHERRSPGERRHAADGTAERMIGSDAIAARVRRQRRYRWGSGIIALTALCIVTGLVLWYRPAPPQSGRDCSAAPQPGVDWRNCPMEGRVLNDTNLIGAQLQNMELSRADLSGAQLVNADLSFTRLNVATLRGADLRSAILKGAGLRSADLSGANLTRADLSYADLRGAVLIGVKLSAARLDNAVWVDGSVCQSGSVGRCLPSAASVD